MLASSLKQHARVMLMGTALAGCGLVAGVESVSAVQLPITRRPALSPAAQQTLGAILAGAPPYEQRLVLNAVQALGPERAETQLTQFRAWPAAWREALGQFTVQILQVLPPQYHQTFIDGLFEVSAAEAQFAMQVANQVASQAAQQNEATSMIAQFGQSVRGLQYQGWRQSERFRGQTGQGWIQALGPFTQYVAPSSGWQGEGYTAPVGTQMYKCPESDWPVPGPNGPPHLGCAPAYAR